MNSPKEPSLQDILAELRDNVSISILSQGENKYLYIDQESLDYIKDTVGILLTRDIKKVLSLIAEDAMKKELKFMSENQISPDATHALERYLKTFESGRPIQVYLFADERKSVEPLWKRFRPNKHYTLKKMI